MHVETLIYAYLAICTAMILFNCACIFVFRRRDRLLQRRSTHLTEQIADQLRLLRAGDTVSDEHRDYLRKKFRRIGNLMAFDETMDQLVEEDADAGWTYIREIRGVFTLAAVENRYHTPMQMAYFAYVIRKYRILRDNEAPVLIQQMMELLEEPSLYCRENGLQAIYSTGDCGIVLRALRKIDQSGVFHHAKLLTDGLLTFTGSHDRLAHVLWEHFESFSVSMQTVILDYIRFSGCDMREALLLLLADESRDDELRFSCIRYFQKFPCAAAFPLLLGFVEAPDARRWEYAAISATALASYPGDRTVLALKRVMSHSNWYIRLNASKALEAFHLSYQELCDVMDNGDRYARESLQYQLDVRQVKEEAAMV